MSSLIVGRLHTLSAEVYKALGVQGRKYLQDMFKAYETHKQSRCSKYLAESNFRNTTYGKNSIKYAGITIWNRLPNSIKDALNIIEFKQLIMGL